MNPLTISLLITFGIVGYIAMGITTHWFVENVRKWPHRMDDEKVIVSFFWPITLTYFFVFYYPVVFLWWLAQQPFKPLKVHAARRRRSNGKKFQVVK